MADNKTTPLGAFRMSEKALMASNAKAIKAYEKTITQLTKAYTSLEDRVSKLEKLVIKAV
jgi:hypothetical protein